MSALAAPCNIAAYCIAGTSRSIPILRPRQPHLRLFTRKVTFHAIDWSRSCLTHPEGWSSSSGWRPCLQVTRAVASRLYSLYDDEKEVDNDNDVPSQPAVGGTQPTFQPQIGGIWHPGLQGGRVGRGRNACVPPHAIIGQGNVPPHLRQGARIARPGHAGGCGAGPSKSTVPALMPRTMRCLTPQQLLGRISQRKTSQVDMAKIDRYKAWIKNTIIPKLNRRGGYGVSVPEMERLIMFFGEIVFWNLLPWTRFRWVPGLLSNQHAYGTTNGGGTLIKMDPMSPQKQSSPRGDDMLGTLVHEACHAILEQQACRSQCGSWACRRA